MTVTIYTTDGESVRVEEPYSDGALEMIQICESTDQYYAAVLTTKDITDLVVLKNIARIRISK